jgi:hypothetical protein
METETSSGNGSASRIVVLALDLKQHANELNQLSLSAIETQKTLEGSQQSNLAAAAPVPARCSTYFTAEF